jgi:hypothetical protein
MSTRTANQKQQAKSPSKTLMEQLGLVLSSHIKAMRSERIKLGWAKRKAIEDDKRNTDNAS